MRFTEVLLVRIAEDEEAARLCADTSQVWIGRVTLYGTGPVCISGTRVLAE
ncbi:hypothetical protein [Oerskovia enterophila]|uniref:Uncharacterized protein n=1 Tax=Oerskovia enterophila TaxID=43678 RepID=A0A163S6Q6_9CELL|nr:hypothetical protein [Oerskovia enterophila]KZM36070.1 hypothetical protein OJAG_12740 [Oerskovia enterophila]OCI32316.1 hypothetical protein OERS_09250 [Oerskovia enterophila]